MAVTELFYQAQADRCAREAETAELPLLREKHRSSQRAWQALADQAHRIETGRRDREIATALRRADGNA